MVLDKVQIFWWYAKIKKRLFITGEQLCITFENFLEKYEKMNGYEKILKRQIL